MRSSAARQPLELIEAFKLIFGQTARKEISSTLIFPEFVTASESGRRRPTGAARRLKFVSLVPRKSAESLRTLRAGIKIDVCLEREGKCYFWWHRSVSAAGNAPVAKR